MRTAMAVSVCGLAALLVGGLFSSGVVGQSSGVPLPLPSAAAPVLVPAVPAAPAPAIAVAVDPRTPPRGEATPAPPPSVDQLIDQLAGLRAKRAELDRQEQAVVTSLRERLRDQRGRLARLGVRAELEVAPPPVPVADRGREPGVIWTHHYHKAR